MGAFAYKAIDATGQRTAGEVEAPDMVSAVKLLRQRGLSITQLDERRGKEQSSGSATRASRSVGGRIPANELTIFSRQFATMVGAGLTILRCLIILEEQVQSKRLRQVIQDVSHDIESGRSLSDALEQHPRVFDRLYVSMVRAGEIGGVLEMTLQRVASSLEARDSLRRKVKSAMTYPLVVFVFAIIVTMLVITILVPMFEKMYTDLGSTLPAITQSLVDLSQLARSVWGLIVLAGIVGAGFMVRQWIRSESGRRVWDRTKLRIPMRIGTITQKLALARFSRTLSALIASGVPMMQAIQVTAESSGSSVIEDAMIDVVRSIEEGRTFSEPLRRHPIFPPMVIQMATIGEETGKIDEMLDKVADFYEDEVDAMIKSITSIVEPIMMIGVGSIIGFIVIALYLPMFKLFNAVK